MSVQDDSETEARKSWMVRHSDVILAVLLGLAAILGAGATYRQTVDDGNAARSLSEASQLRTAASGDLAIGNQKLNADLQVVLQYEQAVHTGQAEYAAFIWGQLMDANLRSTVDWWEAHPEASDPFGDGTPYAEPSYDAAVASNAEADARMELYVKYDARAINYTKTVTLLAVSLFMFGIAAVVTRTSIRFGAMSVGLVVIVWAFILLVNLSLITI